MVSTLSVIYNDGCLGDGPCLRARNRSNSCSVEVTLTRHLLLRIDLLGLLGRMLLHHYLLRLLRWLTTHHLLASHGLTTASLHLLLLGHCLLHLGCLLLSRLLHDIDLLLLKLLQML